MYATTLVVPSGSPISTSDWDKSTNDHKSNNTYISSQISLRKEKRKKKHTCVFGSNPHVAPEDTTQFAPTAPWPRCNSTVSRSITLVESLDVNVKFKDPISD